MRKNVRTRVDDFNGILPENCEPGCGNALRSRAMDVRPG
jgi:hypothetical protein